MALALTGARIFTGEQFLDGRYYLVEEKRTSEGGLISLQIDITDIKKRESSAVYMARHDALTSLPNRHVLTERMHAATTCEHRRGVVALLRDFRAVSVLRVRGSGDGGPSRRHPAVLTRAGRRQESASC